MHSKFNMMQFFYPNEGTFKVSNVHRYELIVINQTFRDIKNSRNDSDVKWYKEFTNAIWRQEFYVKYFLTWIQEHYFKISKNDTNIAFL